MLSARATGVAFILALVASMSFAQTGEADPPAAGSVPGSGAARTQPKPVLTLEQKKKLLVFCTQSANRKKVECKGLASGPEEEPETPES